MRFVNLTPHALTIEGVGTIEPSGSVARCATHRVVLGARSGVRVVAQFMGVVEGLPPSSPDTILVVSAMVLGMVAQDRRGVDVYAPDTGPDAVRENGQIVAVRGLVC